MNGAVVTSPPPDGPIAVDGRGYKRNTEVSNHSVTLLHETHL